MSERTKRIVKFVAPLIILGGGIGLASLLYASREGPGKSEPQTKSVLVETESVTRSSHRLDVPAHGTVVPARQLQLNPQVSGRLVDVHPNLVTGGIVREGETLVQIDRSDYALAVEQRKTDLAQAKANLEIEQGQQAIAKQEWELFKQQVDSEDVDSSLALRKPQLTQARARIDAAEASLEQAKINLRRTSVQAPFNAVVREESTEVGQLVGSQTPLATLVGTDTFWVRASIPVERIPDIAIPGVNATEGSKVEISYGVGRKTIERTGRVIRLQSDLDPQGRMARILIAIDDPLQLASLDTEDKTDPTAGKRGIPVLLDAYVSLNIHGRRTEQLIEVPRRAIRKGDQAFILTDNGELAIETVDIAARRPETLLVRSGIEDGDRLIVTPIATPVEGMKLRAADDQSSAGDDNSSDSEDDAARTQPDTGGGQ